MGGQQRSEWRGEACGRYPWSGPKASPLHTLAHNPTQAATAAIDPVIERLALRALLSIDAAVSIVDVCAPDQPLVLVNDAFCRLTGYARAEVLGRNCRLLQHADSDPSAIALVRQAIEAGQPVSAVLRNRRRDGSAFWNALRLVPLARADGKVTHFVGYQHDLCEGSLSAHAELAMDERNPGQARERFQHAVAEALKEQAAGRRHHVLMLLRGADPSEAGDAALPLRLRVSIAAHLQPRLAEGAALYFPGGFEVAVLAPVRDDQTPGMVAEAVLETLRPVWACRAGLSEPGRDGASAGALLATAALACERATSEEGRRICWPERGRDANEQRSRQILRDVRAALAAGQFRPVFQPIVELATGELTGFEALLRWAHPTLGEVMPGEFIAQLERMPEIVDVTRWILAAALDNLVRWEAVLGRALRVAVNVPAEVLLDDRFVGFTLAELERQGLNPRQLEIELTERSLACADGPAVARLRELRSHGVAVSIDDFGTGWSSLAYLAQLPVDTLKVDLQFTRGVTHSRADAAVARMTVELARGLGLRCVAEGIERPGQRRFFTDLHCAEGQGYLFARPLEVAAVDKLVAAPVRFDEGGGAGLDAPGVERHLLILDDEENVLRALRRTLRTAGFKIHITTSPEEAFEILALHPVGVVLADQRMPLMTGSEFLRRVKDLYPQTRRIVLSGYTDLQSITDAINQGAIYKFLTKPWNETELQTLLETAFAEYELGAENRRLQQALQAANRRLGETVQAQGERMSHGETALDVMHAAIAAVAVPVLGLDPAGDLVMINAAAEQLFAPTLPMLGESVASLLGFDPRQDGATPTRKLSLLGRVHTVHCTPMTAGSRTLGHVLTLLENNP
jgi:PAS domain S-box-containing protein